MSKRKLVCMCENEFEVEVNDFVDLEKEPEIENEILNGSYMMYNCPKCGKVLKPEFPFHMVDKRRRIDIFFIPELDRGTYFRGKLEYNIGTPGRVVIGFPELIEKLMIIRENLDDKAVEAIKMYLLEKAISGNSVDEEKGVEGELIPRIWFDRKENQHLVFKIEGLKENSIGITKISMETYERVLKGLTKSKDKTMKNIISPPYVSINKLNWE